MDAPDYSQQTEQQLRQILGRIDAVRFPERVQEIEARLASLAQAPQVDAGNLPEVVVAGVWRRIGAFFIDIIFLWILGQAAGAVLHAQFSALGAWGILVGLTITVLYFGVMQSRLRGGQSLGMHLLGLKLVSRTGDMLSLPAAFLRAAIFCLAYFMNGFVINLGPDKVWLTLSVLVLLAGIIFSIYYLLLFNRRTRQSLHDLAVGAFVIKTGPGKLSLPTASVWRGHAAFIAIAVIVFAGIALISRQFLPPAQLGSLLAVSEELKTMPGIRSAGVIVSTMHMSNETREQLWINAVVDPSLPDTQTLAQEMVQLLLKRDPGASRQQSIGVSLRSGYDIGIASQWTITSYAHTPEQWKAPGHDSATKIAQ